MGVKFTTDLNLAKITDCIRKEFVRDAPALLESEILNAIMRGNNPTNKGDRRYPKYSDSYSEAITKGRIDGKFSVRPVNLKVSGDLLRSIRVRPVSGGNGIRVEFKHFLADIHNRLGPAGKKSAIRRMLPRHDVPGEEFSNNIMRKLRDLTERIVKRCIR